MANRTVKEARTVKGTNPQYLVEKIIRTRIYDSKYWKEECFALTADLVVDKGMELRFVGGVYGGNIKPTPFLCLITKLLQIQPDKDIIVEFIRQEDFKYIRALGAFYMRLTGSSVDVFKYLEPLYGDYRKLRFMNKNGEFAVVHVDEFIDQLLREDRACDIQLPRLQKREFLEDSAQLTQRVYRLDEDLDDVDSSSSSSDDEDVKRPVKSTSDAKSAQTVSSTKRADSRRSPEHTRTRQRSRSPRRSRSRERHRRSRSKSPRRRKSPERRAPPSSDRHARERDAKEKKSSSGGAASRSNESRGARGGGDDYEREIREANELRAKLGLKPLEQ